MIHSMSKRASGRVGRVEVSEHEARTRNQVNMNLPRDLKDWLEAQATIFFGSAPAIAAFIIKVVRDSGVEVRKLPDFLPPAPSATAQTGTGKRAG